MAEPAPAPLAGRIAVVTGGGGSLGRAVGRTVAAAGGDVALADLDGERAAAAADAVRGEHPGRRVIGLAMDVRDGASVTAGFDAVVRDLGDPDVLVTAAGDNVAPRSFGSISLDTWRGTMAAHADGAHRCISAVLPRMLDRGFGRIVCVSSVAATQGAAYSVDYAAAKGAVIGLVRALAREVAARGITVNAIAPGCFWSAPYDGVPEERLDLLRSTIPAGRIADPMEIASAVAYLASDAGAYTTGEVLSANGGFTYCAHVDEPPRAAAPR